MRVGVDDHWTLYAFRGQHHVMHATADQVPAWEDALQLELSKLQEVPDVDSPS